jgi:hypothetical protein
MNFKPELHLNKTINQTGSQFAMHSFLKRWQAHSGSDPFISMMSVAREDQAISQHLAAILKQSQFNRHSLLNTWINDLQMQGAPESFVNALAFLLDDEVAARALQVLEKDAFQPMTIDQIAPPKPPSTRR